MNTQSPNDPLIGQIVAGRYTVRSRLGQGGMGAIYAATQEPLGREIALKVLLQTYANDATAVARFEKEARSISKLVHPHIVTIFDFGQTNEGDFYIAMELLNGMSLREMLDQRGNMDWKAALQIVQGISIGLVEAHRRNIIHRDLKPENVMLVRSGDDPIFPKILDFGLARTTDPTEEDAQLTQQDMIPGTPSYISPERINGVGNDPRSDLYSLGALWFELLAGRPPFVAPTPVKVIVAHVQEPVPTFHDISPRLHVPEDIELIIRKLLAKNPDERPGSAAHLVKMLQEVVAPEAWSAASPGEMGGHQNDALRNWADDIEDEIPNIDFGDWLGFDDEEETFAKTGEQILPFLEDDVGGVSIETEAVDHTDTFVLLTEPKEESEEAIDLTTRKSPIGASSPYWAKLSESLPPPPSLEDAEASIRNATSRRSVVETFTSFLGSYFDHIVLVQAEQRERLEILCSRQIRHIHDINAVFGPADQFFHLLDHGSPYYGPPPQGSDWNQLYSALSTQVPNGIFLSQIKLKEKPWAFIYADHHSRPLHQDLSELAHLLNVLSNQVDILPT